MLEEGTPLNHFNHKKPRVEEPSPQVQYTSSQPRAVGESMNSEEPSKPWYSYYTLHMPVCLHTLALQDCTEMIEMAQSAIYKWSITIRPFFWGFAWYQQFHFFKKDRNLVAMEK